MGDCTGAVMQYSVTEMDSQKRSTRGSGRSILQICIMCLVVTTRYEAGCAYLFKYTC